MFLGVLYGMLGCSLWGFIYIIPLLLPEYSPATVAMGRFYRLFDRKFSDLLLLSKDAGAFDHIGLDQGLLLRFFRERRLLRSFERKKEFASPAFRLPGC